MSCTYRPTHREDTWSLQWALASNGWLEQGIGMARGRAGGASHEGSALNQANRGELVPREARIGIL